MFQTKVVKKIKTYISVSIMFLQKSGHLWDNVHGTTREATGDNIIWRMQIACWLNKATDTHSNCVILTAFPLQKWLLESVLMSRYTYIACLLLISSIWDIVSISFYKILLYQSSADFSGWFRVKGKPRKTSTKSVFYEFRFGGFCSLAHTPPPSWVRSCLAALSLQTGRVNFTNS